MIDLGQLNVAIYMIHVGNQAKEHEHGIWSQLKSTLSVYYSWHKLHSSNLLLY